MSAAPPSSHGRSLDAAHRRTARGLKVLHVLNGHYLYGGGQQVAYLIAGLQLRGVDNVLTCPGGAAIAGYAATRGAAVHALHCSGAWHFNYYLRLARLIEREQPDIVHAHSRFGSDWLAGLAARSCGVPAVLSRRVDDPDTGWAVRYKYPLYTHTVCISSGVAEILRRCGVDGQRLRVVRSAVDVAPWTSPQSRDALAQTFKLDARRPIVGIVAQLIPRKGIDLALDMMDSIPPERRPQLLIFGRGEQERALRQRAQSITPNGAIRFAGYREDLRDWLGVLDLLLHPAHREGLGIALLQAASAGVPVVAFRTGGVPEAVVDGETGVLVDPGDVHALRSALLRLLEDPAERARMGAAGQARMEREFSTDAMVEGNFDVYCETLAAAQAERSAA